VTAMRHQGHYAAARAHKARLRPQSQRILNGFLGMQTTEQMSVRSPQGAGTVLSNLVRFPQTAGSLGEAGELGFGT
jgi:hypothetical protein